MESSTAIFCAYTYAPDIGLLFKLKVANLEAISDKFYVNGICTDRTFVTLLSYPQQ